MHEIIIFHIVGLRDLPNQKEFLQYYSYQSFRHFLIRSMLLLSKTQSCSPDFNMQYIFLIYIVCSSISQSRVRKITEGLCFILIKCKRVGLGLIKAGVLCPIRMTYNSISYIQFTKKNLPSTFEKRQLITCYRTK